MLSPPQEGGRECIRLSTDITLQNIRMVPKGELMCLLFLMMHMRVCPKELCQEMPGTPLYLSLFMT
jgi:hypothetical protein